MRAAAVPIDVMAAIQWRSAMRTAAFFLVAASALASLVLALPVASYYDTVDYAFAEFDVEVIGLLDEQQLGVAVGAADAEVTVAFLAVEPARIVRGSSHVSPSKIYFTDTPEQMNASWFSDATVLVAGETGEDWLDVSADVARRLGAGPGDWVTVPFGTGDYDAQIRRVMATARDTIPFVAAGPRTESIRALLPDDLQDVSTVALMRVRGDPEGAAAAVTLALGADLVEARTRLEALAANEQDPFYSAALLVAISALGFACLTGLGIREASVLIARRRTDLAVIAALGAPRRAIAIALSLIEGVFVVLATVAAYLVVSRVAFEQLFAAALPPAFVLPLVATMLAAALAYIATLFITTALQLRSSRLLELLAAGRNP